MDQTTLVRIFVVAYGALAAFAAVILWLNAGAEDATKNAIITVSSALPLIAAVASYVVPHVSNEHQVLMLIFDTKQKQFVFGDVPGNPYYRAYGAWFVGNPVAANSLDEASDVAVDLATSNPVTGDVFTFSSSGNLGPFGGGRCIGAICGLPNQR